MKAIAVVVVAVVATGVLTGCGGRSAAHPVAAAAASSPPPVASASPTMPPPEPSPSATPPPVTVVAPKTLLGRSAATEQALKDAGTKVIDGWGAPAGGIKASGVYGSASRKDAVVFVAATGSHPGPNEMLDATASLAFSKYTFHPVDPGALNGAARCTPSSGGSTPQAICMWADSDSFGLVFFLYSTAANADRLLAQARSEIELLQ